MRKYRAVIERTEVTREIVEVEADGVRHALQKVENYAGDAGNRSGVVTIRKPDEVTKGASLVYDVIQINRHR